VRAYDGVIAGATVRRGDTEAVIPGSVELNCNRCKAPVWLAPTGQQMMATRNLEICCVPCAIKDAARKGQKFETPTPAQQGEIARELARRRGQK
jgi:hypothetical protein